MSVSRCGSRTRTIRIGSSCGRSRPGRSSRRASSDPSCRKRWRRSSFARCTCHPRSASSRSTRLGNGCGSSPARAARRNGGATIFRAHPPGAGRRVSSSRERKCWRTPAPPMPRAMPGCHSGWRPRRSHRANRSICRPRTSAGPGRTSHSTSGCGPGPAGESLRRPWPCWLSGLCSRRGFALRTAGPSSRRLHRSGHELRRSGHQPHRASGLSLRSRPSSRHRRQHRAGSRRRASRR